MILRDINHPSIVLWSIGNEIPMRESAKGYELARELAAEVRSIDPSRAVTSAVPMVKDKDEPYLEALDVGGYNYSPNRYVPDHATYPARVRAHLFLSLVHSPLPHRVHCALVHVQLSSPLPCTGDGRH